MAITISGENNNDRILASDGVIDEISGINIVGLLTAGHINVDSSMTIDSPAWTGLSMAQKGIRVAGKICCCCSNTLVF